MTKHICPTLWIMQKKLRAGPPDMFLRSWYLNGTKYFRPTILVGWKWRSQLGWVIKPVLHDLVRRIRFWKIKSPEQDFQYLYWTMSKILFWNLFVAVCCSHMLQCVAVVCYSRKRKRVVMNVCVLQCVVVIRCSVLQSYVARGNGRGSWWMCVCCSVLQSYVAVCCSHVLFAEMEEGRDECVCVAVCCSHIYCSMCCSVLQSYVVCGNGRGPWW